MLTALFADLLAPYVNCSGSRRGDDGLEVGQHRVFNIFHLYRRQSNKSIVIYACDPWLFGDRDNGGGFEAGWQPAVLQGEHLDVSSEEKDVNLRPVISLRRPHRCHTATRRHRVLRTKWRVFKSAPGQLAEEERTRQVGDRASGSAYHLLAGLSAPTNMPAIKKERLDGDDMALAAFNQSEYLAPLNATAIPVVTPHPPPYDHIFAHHRAYLGLHDSALHHQHLHHHTDDLMLERFSSIPDFQPFFDNGEPCIEVECGENKALLYINKLCQGSKGPSIKYRGEWLTPNEFQFVSGRETAKDWKRSIRHKGKSLKTLMSKGILQVHPPICDCPGCRISSPVNRGRLAEKRTIPLPPNRVPKKELASIFSSDDSEGSERASGDHAHIKQEDELHYSIMRKRELTHPPPLLSPQSAPHIALGPHLRPPFLGMPSALCQAPGYGFLQPAQAEIFARQQEMLRKQNLARLEMSADLLRQKELENLHHRQQQQRLLGSDPLGGLPPGLPPDHPALRSLHDIPEGHPLREELARRSNAMLVLRHGAATPLLTLNHQQQQPGASSTLKDGQAHSSTAGPDAESRKGSRRGPQVQLRAGDHTGGGREERGREVDREGQDEEMKDSDSEAEMNEVRQGSAAAKPSSRPRDREREAGKETGSKGVCDSAKEAGESSGRLSAPCSSAGAESPSRQLFTPGLNKGEAKYHLPPGFIPPLPTLHAQSLPFGFPYANPYFHTGSMGGLFMDGEDSGTANSVEDISRWSVEDVCGFISSLAGCAEYTQVFREHAIDGETLPLLTEEHLLNTMGLKLGPALKIRSQVARRVGRIFYMTSFPLALPLPPSATLRPPERDRDPLATPSDTPLPLSLAHPHRPASTSSSSSPYSGPTLGRSSPKQENGTGATGAAGYETKTAS
ncbi:uncharacterized protein samd11 [Lampris incognitus]|uniref:uncharacterized protein samd11 n=1 Tax=Lampris incognitus TaxID=2546036 RepID=UPI0024B5B5EA|nr:uncharacterized protein samd11 [Lampris incognitus]